VVLIVASEARESFEWVESVRAMEEPSVANASISESSAHEDETTESLYRGEGDRRVRGGRAGAADASTMRE
jgi:hypothetical protein